jgi:hypothetical protein
MREKNTERMFARTALIVGDIISILAVIFSPIPYNITIIGVYTFICVLSLIALNKSKPGILMENNTNIPLSFALLKIYKEGEESPFIKKVADKFGNYFVRIPGGRYYLTVEKKNTDESYTEVLRTADIEIKDGVVNFDIKV